ncbi:MAG: hypothetical protein IANPNBLG_04705 [Bryobacteraceae bacterium]|nr:hypothetical protein [Bryobacteraceae bacterium]
MRQWLAAAAGLSLLLASCAPQQPKGLALDATIERYIPGDTVVLAGANVERLVATPLYRRLAGERKIPQLDEFARKTRLDPEKDIQELLAASNGKDAIMMARVRIRDEKAVEAALEKEGAARTPFGKYTLFGNGEGAVVFINGSIALAGRTEHLKTVLSGAKEDDSRKRAILGELAKLSPERQLWAVAIGGFAPMPLPETGNLANLNRVFQSLQSVTMTVDLANGVKLAATGVCAREADAKQLKDMLRGLIGFGRLSTPSDKPEMLRFFDGIQVDQAGGAVNLHANVPADMVDYFLKLTEKPKPAA